MNILLLEDDIQLNTTIENFLIFKDYEVTALFDGEKGIEHIDMIKYDFYIIDINLPNVSGLDIVKYIRNKDLTTPIVMITASIEIDNFKTAFENGCNEYIKKPFHLEELEIRINNLLNKQTNSIITISSNIIYDLEYEELKIANEVIKLRKKERRLITLLLQNINNTVTYEVIENYVWENEIKPSYPIRQLVSELNNKFPKDKKYILSVNGLGYKFNY